ncbi:hypothetical protein ACH4S8_41600 [Streptomyces sp. NPDC021080]|uniref:hypothetical protein n=1 Tax=Streptomyces sp. NPDC021080 TaxID=3365110 RepID=UPI0037BA8489
MTAASVQACGGSRQAACALPKWHADVDDLAHAAADGYGRTGPWTTVSRSTCGTPWTGHCGVWARIASTLCCLHRVESAVPIEEITEMVRHQRGYLLLEWIRQAGQDASKPMKGSGFLRQDLHAVTAGLTLPWSSGVVEGHVNRVRTLKRAMCGRASFDLLRTRIPTRS